MFLEQKTSEDGISNLTSALTFVIDLMSASVFNVTRVNCTAHVPIGGSLDLIILSAKLYVHGKENPNTCP